VDELANVGVDYCDQDLICEESQRSEQPLLLECIDMARLEGIPPYGVLL
jgi:hypothetical protein